MNGVILTYKQPRLCSLSFHDGLGETPVKYGKGALEVRFHEWGRPYPAGYISLRPDTPYGKLTIHSTDVYLEMDKPRKYPHLRQINRVTNNRYDMILTCYQWTDEQIEAQRHCLPVDLREVPSIDYTLTFNVDGSGLLLPKLEY